MSWNLVQVLPEPNDIKRVTVVDQSPLVQIVGIADPMTLTSAGKWKVWKETYDQSGMLSTLLFMNGSRKRDQIYDNIQASSTTWA